MRVFISSTCYDLLDVRTEVAAALTDIGITPVLSDDKLSDFRHPPEVNSIERCLVNLESCDAVVLIIDSRYGGILPGYGISATELEYNHSVEKNIPVHFFVRDRTIAEFGVHRKSPGKAIQTAWVKKESATNLFGFLQRHSDYREHGSNWYDPFSNSIDLKLAIQRRFSNRVSAKRIAALIGENRFPVIKSELVLGDSLHLNELNLQIRLTNNGQCPAFEFKYGWLDREGFSTSDILTTGETALLQVMLHKGKTWADSFFAEYSDYRGVRVRQVFSAYVTTARLSMVATKIETISREFRRIEPIELPFIES